MIARYSASQLRDAVEAICPDIQARVESRASTYLSDEALWHELSCCLLSSQVPYPLAQAAADEIDRAGLLKESGFRTPEELQVQLTDVLNSPLRVGSTWRRYRFPGSRSEQLAQTWAAVTARAGSLLGALEEVDEADEVRRWLVVNAPGIGPKQASMFLRNIGISYDLAILDRHVLDYMNMLGMHRGKVRQISGLAAYRATEVVLLDHAAEIGYPVGILDWAIWIVMRVISGERRL